MGYRKEYTFTVTVTGYGKLAQKLQEITNNCRSIADIEVTRDTINDDFKVSYSYFVKED